LKQQHAAYCAFPKYVVENLPPEDAAEVTALRFDAAELRSRRAELERRVLRFASVSANSVELTYTIININMRTLFFKERMNLQPSQQNL
jgi:hypothetical protein